MEGNRLLSHGVLYAAGTFAPVVIGVLVTPFITRALGASEYGVVGIGVPLYQFGAIFLGLGLSGAITRHAIMRDSGIPGARALIYSGTASAFALAVLLVLTVPLWGHLLAPSATKALVWPVISAFGVCVLTLSQSLFRAEGRVRVFVVFGALSAATGPTLGLFSVLGMGASAGNYLMGLAAGHLLVAFAALAYTGRPRIADFSAPELVAGLKFGLPTVPHSAAGSALTASIVISVSWLSGIEDAGRIQLALLLGTAPLTIVGAFNNAWAPMLYRASESQRPRLISDSTRLIALIVLMMMTAYCALVVPVATLIAGGEVYDSGISTAALIASASTAMLSIYLVEINAVFLVGRTWPLAITTPIAAAIAIMFGAAGQAALGSYPSAALALPVFHFMMCLFAVMLRRRSGQPRPAVSRAVIPLLLSVALPISVALVPAYTGWIIGLYVPMILVTLILNRSVIRSFA